MPQTEFAQLRALAPSTRSPDKEWDFSQEALPSRTHPIFPRQANGLTSQQEAEYTAIFKKFDRDGDGQIDADELASALSTFSKTTISRERAARIIDDNDTNRNGTIEINEFIAFMSIMLKMDSQFKKDDRMKKMFEQFDKNGDGKITAEELKSVLTGTCPDITESQVKQMIKQADLDGDGKIDYNEFVQMMT